MNDILSVHVQLSRAALRALSRICGPRTGVTRQAWVAAAIEEKLERDTGSTVPAVGRRSTAGGGAA